jgi:hypothetical protein
VLQRWCFSKLELRANTARDETALASARALMGTTWTVKILIIVRKTIKTESLDKRIPPLSENDRMQRCLENYFVKSGSLDQISQHRDYFFTARRYWPLQRFEAFGRLWQFRCRPERGALAAFRL